MTLLIVLSKCTLLLVFIMFVVISIMAARNYLSKSLQYFTSSVIICMLFILNSLFSIADNYPKDALIVCGLILLQNLTFILIVRDRNPYKKLKIYQHYTKSPITMESYKFLQFHHDIYNHLICVREFSKHKDYGRMDEYLDFLLQQVNCKSWEFQTNSSIVDAILNHKAALATQNGIALIPTINDLSRLNILQDRYITAILSNTLDNAIESCSQNKKYILFKMIINETHVIISIQNPIERQTLRTGSIKKQKPDTGLSGVGLSSVKYSLEKLKGDYMIINKGNNFRISIIIPIPDKAENFV